METKNIFVQTDPETKEAYEAPVLKAVEVKVEMGYDCSLGNGIDAYTDDEYTY